MYAHPEVKTSPDSPVPDTMKAWVLGDPGQLKLSQKPVPVPKKAEVLVRIDAIVIVGALPAHISRKITPPFLVFGAMGKWTHEARCSR